MRLGLLLCLGITFLVPLGSESRIVSEDELKNSLKAMLHLAPKYRTNVMFKDWIISKVVSEAKFSSHLNTSTLAVMGERDIESSKQTTKATMMMTTTKSTANKRRRKRELELDDGSGSGSGSGMIPSESMRGEEEDKFDEEELFLDDNNMNGDSTEEDGGSSNDRQPSKTWSICYYGIFQLSDSHFCDSGYRWSRNVCKISCSALLDDDITDDINCLLKSKYFWYMLHHHIPLLF